MDILQKIRKQKEKEVAERKSLYPLKLLQKSMYYDVPVVSLAHYIQRKDKSGIIAEFKKKSPSEGFINQYADVEAVTMGYMQSGASALSVLTDETFFGGSSEDLKTARTYNYCPILRKDFIIDEYQIHETKSIGADALLLIAEMLTGEEVKRFSETAHEIGLEVLLEIHDEDEISKYAEGIAVMGVNNRNLRDFTVDIQHSIDLYSRLPAEPVKISESGIHDARDMIRLYKAGFEGFLVGTQFMRTPHPAKACRSLIEAFQKERQSR
ncbi:indole-3-glycerol phosphate synthase TrpC [Membranicola marinus]|uniref:indole-3-glycerol-phosphate synthase n=1 Tax=Membranihabitans marinus TaxID=1227546 RepID=A0A953LDF8_9BACT|nr:indole-3-glycerol phosphate synthase TrpC [Membranihabitans marinus]MBY5958814.1 indole-3-glycerol phosphate synthase TrpC [Membranihabitans marinus]